MSQEDIDRLMDHLREYPEEMRRAAALPLRELVVFAASKGFVITEEELKARQALAYLVNGI